MSTPLQTQITAPSVTPSSAVTSVVPATEATPLSAQGTTSSSAAVTAVTPVSSTSSTSTAPMPVFVVKPPKASPVPGSSSPAPSLSGVGTTRADSISYGSLLGSGSDPALTSPVSAAAPPPVPECGGVPLITHVSMTSVQSEEIEPLPESTHEIHCDHISCYSQTSMTNSYLTPDNIEHPAAFYGKRKRGNAVKKVAVKSYGAIRCAKTVLLYPRTTRPLRCKANPKLLKLLMTRQKTIRNAASRGHRYFKITAVRFPQRETRQPWEQRDPGIGLIETHVTAIAEFIASPVSAHSRLGMHTKLDYSTYEPRYVDIDVIDERAGAREDDGREEQRVPEAQVRADYIATLDRPAGRTESLASIFPDGFEAATIIKDVAIIQPIHAMPPRGFFRRLFSRLTFGVIG